MENTDIDLDFIEDTIYKCPLILENESNPAIIKAINSYLPYSTGFEVECDIEKNTPTTLDIPNLISYNVNSSESKFRIPKGIEGLIVLYKVSQFMQKYFIISQSGIHYHIDCTSWFDKLQEANEEFRLNYIKTIKSYVLTELSKWEYPGTYNRKELAWDQKGNWATFRTRYKTLEIRIGELTFDYEILVKRIIHCNEIVRNLKIAFFQNYSNLKVLQLKNELENIEKDLQVDNSFNLQEINEIIKKREIKLK